MTEQEELELLELEEQEAKAKGVAPPAQAAPPQVGKGETFVNTFSNMLPAGKQAVDAISAGIVRAARPERGARLGPAALAAGAQEPAQPDYIDTYRDMRDTRERRTAAGEAQNPWTAGAAKGLGLAASIYAGGKLLPTTGAAASPGARLLANLKTSAGVQGVNSLLNGKADWTRGELGQAIEDFSGANQVQEAINQAQGGHYLTSALNALSAGPLGGVVAGGVASALPEAVRAVPFLRRPLATVGPDAQRLGELGVDTSKLTLGQLNPDSNWAQLEEVGAQGLAGGHGVKTAREVGKEAWRQAAQDYDAAPLGPQRNPANMSPQQRFAQARKDFNTAYDAVRDQPIATAGPGQQSMGDQLRRGFAAATANKQHLITDADRAAVGSYLENQASIPGYTPGKPGTIEPLMSVRENIRNKLAQVPYDSPWVAPLQDAESEVTRQIEGNLRGDPADFLRTTDAQYAKHKLIEDALTRAGDSPSGYQPTHLSAAVKASMNPGPYASGEGGPLRELAALGQETFNTKVPHTGFGTLVHNIPGSKYAAGPLAAIANQPGVKQVLLNGLGQAPATGDAGLRLQSIINALRKPEPRQSRQPSPVDKYLEVADAP